MVGAWAKENGYKRQPRTDANWTRPLGSGENLVPGFRCGPWGGGAGESTRELYKQYAAGEKPYRLGDFATFGCYDIEDVRRHTGFLVRHLPDIVARFLEGRVATPNPVPQPESGTGHLFCQRRKVARSGVPGAALNTNKEER